MYYLIWFDWLIDWLIIWLIDWLIDWLIVPSSQDSYLLKYFDALATDLRVGPPVYFVTTDGFDYTNTTAQNKVCGGSGCNDDSLTQQIFYAAQISE